MPSATMTKMISIAGLGIQSQITKTAGFQASGEPELPASFDGELTTRTDDNTGVVTADTTSHGITVGNKVAVFWTDSSEPKARYDMDVTAVSSDEITVDGGSGDNLPALNSDVIIAPRQAYDVSFDAADIAMIAAGCQQRAIFQFHDGTDTFTQELAAQEAYEWASGLGTSNPLVAASVGNVTTFYAYNGSTTAVNMPFGVLLTGSTT